MVILDVRTRWNSTFEMLVRARELKEVRLIIVILYLSFLFIMIKIKIKDILFNLLAIKYIK